jgi:hypothetical protein
MHEDQQHSEQQDCRHHRAGSEARSPLLGTEGAATRTEDLQVDACRGNRAGRVATNPRHLQVDHSVRTSKQPKEARFVLWCGRFQGSVTLQRGGAPHRSTRHCSQAAGRQLTPDSQEADSRQQAAGRQEAAGSRQTGGRQLTPDRQQADSRQQTADSRQQAAGRQQADSRQQTDSRQTADSRQTHPTGVLCTAVGVPGDPRFLQQTSQWVPQSSMQRRIACVQFGGVMISKLHAQTNVPSRPLSPSSPHYHRYWPSSRGALAYCVA